MSDSDVESATWVGFPYAADRGYCPACFHRLSSTTCSHCGLVLADPRAIRVLDLGRNMVQLEKERQRLIEEIREAHRPAPEPVAPPWSPAAVPQVVTREAAPPAAAVDVPAAALPDTPLRKPDLEREAAPTATKTATPPPVAPAPVKEPKPPRPPRRRLTVPVLLLIVGVTLVGVAAIFFLVLAWNSADIGVKSIIIAGVTLATMVAASVLRRFSLKATAEGIAVLGVILLALDAWAVRLNDLFGAGAMRPALYAGIAALVVGALCRLWAVVSRLRGPDLAATLALPAGLGLLVAGLVPLDASGAVTAGLLGTAVAGLAHALPAPWSAARPRPESVPERAALAVIGVASVVGGGVMLAVGLESLLVQLVMAGAVVVLGIAHAVLLRPRGETEPLPFARALAASAAAIAAAAGASIGWQSAAHSDLPVYSQLVGPVVAVGVAVGLDRWKRRDVAATAARIAAGIVAAAGTLMMFAVLLLRGQQATFGWTLWTTPPFGTPADVDATAAIMALVGSAVVAVLVFFAPSVDRPGWRQARPVAGLILVLTAAFATGIPSLVLAVSIATAGVALAGLARKGMRVGWGTAAALGTVAAFLVGLTQPWLWAIGAVVAVAVPVIARIVLPADIRSDILLALAPVGVGSVVALIAPSAIDAAFGVTADSRAILVLIQWVAVLALAAAVVLRLDPPSRSAVAISSYVLSTLSFLVFLAAPAGSGSVSAWLGEPSLAIVRGGLLLIALVVVSVRRTPIESWASLPAALLVAPAAASVCVASLETAQVQEPGWTALTVTGVAAMVGWIGALLPAGAFGSSRRGSASDAADGAIATTVESAARTAAAIRAGYRRYARIAGDSGAFVAVLAVVPTVPAGFRWAVLALVALLFAGTAVTPGWAAPASDRMRGIAQISSEGVRLAQAPRRLLAWPALLAATLALWVWLDGAGAFEVEAYVLPPAIALLVFAGVLVWLRREAEATMAVALAFTLGLVIPALAGLPSSSVRGTIVAGVAAALAAALAWTPARRVRLPALAGATVALVALAAIAFARAIVAPAAPAWVLLLVVSAYVSAYGFVRGGRARAELSFAAVVPSVAVAVGSVAMTASLHEPLVVTIALMVLGAMHLAAAALRTLPLGTATRWTALAGAVLIASGAYVVQDLGAVEIASMPIAVMLLAGAALAMWRRARSGQAWPGSERVVWLVGLAVSVAPSVATEANDVRTWLVIVATLLAAVECVVVPLPESLGLKTPSALLLSAGAVAMGTRALLDPAVASGELAAIAAGVGALAVSVTMVWQRQTDDAPAYTTLLCAAGSALAVGSVVVHADGELVRTTVTALIGGAVGVGGALLLRWRRWAPLGGVIAVAGAVVALVSVTARFAQIATAPGFEPDVWALAGVGLMVAIGVAALRSSESRAVAVTVNVAFCVALVLFAAAEVVLLGRTELDELRTILTVTALTAVGVVAVIRRERLGLSLAITAATLVGVVGLTALLVFGVRPVELVTVPAAVGMIVLGARALVRDPETRTWPTLGPGLALLTIPSLVYDFTAPSLVDEFPSFDSDASIALWRMVGLGVVAIGMVVAGAMWRLQAPLVLGSVVLLVHAVAQLWPWISDLYALVPWWLWLGLGGALLIFLAARYEKRMRELRAAFTTVTSLR